MAVYLMALVGLALLIVGAEGLVKGASRLAARLGISPLIIGLTVVAFGTSSPELTVSLQAALDDQAGIAVGNVVGSNIFNVLFILGVSALVAPLRVAHQLVRLDIPLMVLITLIVLVLAFDRQIGRLDGLGLVVGLVVYTTFLFLQGRREGAAGESAEAPVAAAHWSIDMLLVAGGLALMVVGSRWFVDGAVALAAYLGVSDQIIGLTIIAAGTSLPEVLTSIIAVLRGERDIAVGNVVGSNIFNLLGVLGLTALLAPSAIDVSAAMVAFDMPVMLAVALACLPICFTGRTINRWEGALLMGYYVAYTLYLILAATQHDALAGFADAMLYVVMPITALTLIVFSLREWRGERR
ncbi:calcium/sodium antiporter [Billgrantia saliphila]|uniref:calcium/sodium antiporter n=1 Tax=Billgrantia saliphila TaxID=1848458 RepID=UPI000CE3FDA3|nr:calcium/sodium antiporter [Halomonas saliphila]